MGKLSESETTILESKLDVLKVCWVNGEVIWVLGFGTRCCCLLSLRSGSPGLRAVPGGCPWPQTQVRGLPELSAGWDTPSACPSVNPQRPSRKLLLFPLEASADPDCFTRGTLRPLGTACCLPKGRGAGLFMHSCFTFLYVIMVMYLFLAEVGKKRSEDSQYQLIKA